MQSTSDSIYTPENIPLDEALYGKHLISLGGLGAYPMHTFYFAKSQPSY